MGNPTTQTWGRGGESPTWDKFPHVPVFLWQTSLKPFPTNALSHNTNIDNLGASGNTGRYTKGVW